MIKEMGVIIKKYVIAMNTPETIFPRDIPILNNNLLIGFNISGFVKQVRNKTIDIKKINIY